MPNVFSMIYGRMDWLNSQLATSAENIQNANVPGWDRRVLEPLSFKNTLNSSAAMPLQTDAKHLSGTLTQDNGVKAKSDKHRATTLSGNSVSIEEELQTINQATIDHAQMVQLYKSLSEIRGMPLRS